jgi:hypothetical protein
MKKAFAFLLATSAILTGCHTGGAYAPVNATKFDLENHSPFVELDSRVARSVTSSGVQETRLPDGRLQVAVNIRNREERRIEVQINCEFKDAQGFTIDRTPFQTLILRERAQETATFISMNNQAQRYTIRVSESH